MTRWKITAVVETRNIDDDRKPIPGTGDARNCDRCGAAHEVWVEMREQAPTLKEIPGFGSVVGGWTSTGASITVGVSCARVMVRAGNVANADLLRCTRVARAAA